MFLFQQLKDNETQPLLAIVAGDKFWIIVDLNVLGLCPDAALETFILVPAVCLWYAWVYLFFGFVCLCLAWVLLSFFNMKICLLSNLRNLGTLSFFLFVFKEICLYFCKLFISFMGWEMHVCFPSGSVVKNPPANAANMGLIPGSGRAPVGGNGYPLQYSCLGSPTDRGT